MYLNAHISRQKGLGLPSALFIILIMILIVTAINQLNEVNAQAYSREWLSQRAFYAAESGAQLAAAYVLNTSETAPSCNGAFINSLSFSALGLSSCSVSVACSAQTVTAQVFTTLTSTSRCGTGPDQATRIVQVRLVD